MMKIELNEIYEASKIVFSLIELLGFKEVEVYVDYYWCIGLGDAYSSKIPESVIGSLVLDMEWLAKVFAKENPLTTIDIERLSNVIRIVGHAILKNHIHQNDAKPVIIKIDDLKNLCEVLIKKAERAGFKKLEIDIGNYWDIDPSSAYDFNHDPKVIRKSLTESWTQLIFFLNQRQSASIDQFDDLANIIKFIGEAIDRSENKINWLIQEE